MRRWLPWGGGNATLCTGYHTGSNKANMRLTGGSYDLYLIDMEAWVLKSGNVITDYQDLSHSNGGNTVYAWYNCSVAKNTYLVGRGDCPAPLYVEGSIDF
jgi:hypothetical protein